MRGETPIRQETRTQAPVRKMPNSNGPRPGGGYQPGSAGTGEVRTFPASHPSRGARRSSRSCEREPDAYGNPRSRCPEANSSKEELTDPGILSLHISVIVQMVARDWYEFFR